MYYNVGEYLTAQKYLDKFDQVWHDNQQLFENSIQMDMDLEKFDVS